MRMCVSTCILFHIHTHLSPYLYVYTYEIYHMFTRRSVQIDSRKGWSYFSWPQSNKVHTYEFLACNLYNWFVGRCVLLGFVNPMLGNRYGPGVSSYQQTSDNNLGWPDTHSVPQLRRWLYRSLPLPLRKVMRKPPTKKGGKNKILGLKNKWDWTELNWMMITHDNSYRKALSANKVFSPPLLPRR